MQIADPYSYDRALEIQSKTEVIAGDVTETWASAENNVMAQLIFAGGNDKDEGGQPLNVERRRYKIMESGRSFDPDNVRFREVGETDWYYVTRVTPWKGSKWITVIEGIERSDS